MPFTVKDWKDFPDTSTPITAIALEDLETRVTNYAATSAPYINVADYLTGGVPSGTDDTSAFTSALSVAGAGGTVYAPGHANPYLLDSLAFTADGQTIVGDGPGGTVLKAKTSAARVVTIEGRWLSKLKAVTIDGRSKASDGVRIRGLNTAAGQSSQRNMLEHVRVTQCATGVKVDGAGASDQVDKNLYVELMVDNCTVGFHSTTTNSQCQTFIGGSIDDCVTHAIKTNGQMSFIGWMAQQTTGGSGVTMIEFIGSAVDSIVMVDCITETHDITFDSTASNFWPINGVQVYASVLQANTHIAKIDRGGSPVALIVRGSRLVGGTIDLRGNSTVYVDEFNDGSSTTTVTRTGAATRWHRKTLAGAEGQTVASATSITIPAGAEVVFITGTTNIQNITTATAYHGQEVSLMFSTSLTVQTGGTLKLAVA